MSLERMAWVLVMCLSLVDVCRADNLDDGLITILNGTNGAATFTSYLQGRTDFVNQLNGGNFTLIVPNDQALAAQDLSSLDNDTLTALLQYHAVQGIYPVSTFSTTPVFVPTLLNNPNFTNVTGGQRAELRLQNGTAAFLTGLKSPSKVIQADIFYAGGLIQLVDSVPKIPSSLPDVVTQAQLSDLTALLNKGGWLAPNVAFDNMISQPDFTVFGPNDPRFGASFIGFDNLSTDAAFEVFEYHCVEGKVLYSPELTNNTHFDTLANLSITSYIIGNDTWINNALITTKDYLTANGVLQVINYLLDPNVTDATPSNQTEFSDLVSTSETHSLSSGAKAGIGVGVAALVLLVGAGAALYIQWRRRKRQEKADNTGSSVQNQALAAELGGKPVLDVVEADGRMIYETGGHPAPLYEQRGYDDGLIVVEENDKERQEQEKEKKQGQEQENSSTTADEPSSSSPSRGGDGEHC